MFAQRADKALFEQMKDAAYGYMDSVDQRPVFPTDSALAELAVFEERVREYERLNSYREHKSGSPFFTTLQRAQLQVLERQNRLREILIAGRFVSCNWNFAQKD